MNARKSWFFFNREFVCLGTAISSDAAYPVYTTLNQCLLNNQVIVKTNKNKSQLNSGEHNLQNVAWVLHDGVAYIFPSPTNIALSNRSATGNWRQINHHPWAKEELVQKDVFSLWLNHGAKPQNAVYAYIVVPGIDSSAIDNYNKKSDIAILANKPDIQAVQHKGLNRTEIVFYKAGTIKISDDITLTTESPCLIMLKTNGKAIEELVVSDPTRKLKSIELTVNIKVEGRGDKWQSTWDHENKTSAIHIELPTEGYAGSSVVLQLVKKV